MTVIMIAGFGFSIAGNTAAQEAKTNWDDAAFPEWAKDLRRAEIVLFGAFPFAWFTTSFALDVYRSSQHDWDNKYYPWPLKPAGAIELTDGEWWTTIYGSVILSIGVAAADYVIQRIKRGKQVEEEKKWAEGDPIIIREPMNVEPERNE
jgi:hypothetical protein